MASLQNLIFSPSDQNVLYCRPASTQIMPPTFPTTTTIPQPRFISVFKIVGTRVYGMINSRLNPGHDQPFAFDLLTNSLLPVAGITNANTPVSPSASGDWVPPTMDVIGTKVVVTHPGFDGVTHFFGWFDISNPAAITWSAGNTATSPLPVVPTAVAQFNGRAYYLCNITNAPPGLYASDELDATTITNPTFILTFGDLEPLTALAGLPLSNQLGGIIQSLIIFKGSANLYQVTGDPATNTAAGPWTKNSLNVATGTLAPRSIAPTPLGLLFVSPQGLRLIDFNAKVSDPIGANGAGISTSFISCPVPSRIAAAANASVYRVSLTDVNGQQREFWYDMPRKTWTGPHSFPATCIGMWRNTFIIAPVAVPNALWQSDWLQTPVSAFVEAGLAMMWAYQTSMLPDAKTMRQMEMHKTLLTLSCGGAVTFNAAGESGQVLQAASIAPVGGVSSWGSLVWASGMYYQQTFSLQPVEVPWTGPLVFGRLSLQARGVSDSVTRVGALQLLYEQLGFTQRSD